MTIKEACGRRIPRVRRSIWAVPTDYLRLPILPGGMIGPWAELYADVVQRGVMKIKPGSQKVGMFELDNATDWQVYTGPVSPFERDPENFAKSYEES